MNNKFEIGDIVYDYKKGLGYRYEVVKVYEVNEYFQVKKIDPFYPFDMVATSALFYSTRYFKPVPWILRRVVLVEKMRKPIEIQIGEFSPRIGLLTRYANALL
jgi:hypothetical protein